jgi:nitrite reductase/ring-hydroxylating ferredoxin subunit
MNWTRVAAENELAEGVRQVVKVEGHSILVLRHGGEIFAIQAYCPHLGGHLKDGRLTGDGHIICPLHHSEFDLRTGEIIHWAPWPPGVGPVLGAIRQEHRPAIYPTKVEGGVIWVGTE